MTPDEAQVKVEQALTKAKIARDGLLDAIRESWQRRANEIVMQAVTGQPEVTKAMDAADRAVLKVNLGMTIASGTSYVDSIFATAIDLDTLAAGARLNTTGGVNVSLYDGPSLLAQPLHDLLANAGYDVSLLKNAKHGSSGRFTPSEVNLGVDVPARVLGNAAEELGKARLQLAAVQHEKAAGEAAELWDEA